MALIDKDRVDEILRNLWKEDDGHNSEHRICYNKALQEVQCEIDTLEEADVDIEKEAEQDWNTIFPLGYGDTTFLTLNHKEFMAFVKHYYELGLKAKQNG